MSVCVCVCLVRGVCVCSVFGRTDQAKELGFERGEKESKTLQIDHKPKVCCYL